MHVHRDFYDRKLAPKREIDVLRARLPAGSHLTYARGTHSSRQHATGGEGSSVQNRPEARPAATATTSTQPRSASKRPRPQIQTKPKVILKLSCLRALTPAQPTWATGERNFRKGQCISQKGRSFRAHATGPQVKRRAGLTVYRIVLQRSRPRRGGREERGFERPSMFHFQAEIIYVHCLRFSPGPFYIR